MELTAALQIRHRFVAACIPEDAAMLESRRVKAHRPPEGHTSGQSRRTTALSEYYRCLDRLQGLHRVRQSLVDTLSARSQNQSEMIQLPAVLPWHSLAHRSENVAEKGLRAHQRLRLLLHVVLKNRFVSVLPVFGWNDEHSQRSQIVTRGYHSDLAALLLLRLASTPVFSFSLQQRRDCVLAGGLLHQIEIYRRLTRNLFRVEHSLLLTQNLRTAPMHPAIEPLVRLMCGLFGQTERS